MILVGNISRLRAFACLNHTGLPNFKLINAYSRSSTDFFSIFGLFTRNVFVSSSRPALFCDEGLLLLGNNMKLRVAQARRLSTCNRILYTSRRSFLYGRSFTDINALSSSHLLNVCPPCLSTRFLHSDGKSDGGKEDTNKGKESNSSDSSRFTKGLKRFIVPALAVGALFHILGYVAKWLKTDATSKVLQDQNVSTNDRNSQDGMRTVSINHAIVEGRKLVTRFKTERLCPGLTIAVSVDGNIVWAEGIGLSDIENDLPCHTDTVMRIASISKPLTMTVLAKLWQEGKLDLDVPVQKYVPSWPDKYYEGKKVDITTRQLVSMLGGIRHYDKDCGKKKDKESQDREKESADKKKEKRKKKERDREGEFSRGEYYIKRHYSTVTEALELFKDDPLCSLPGTQYLYSTHTWTLISAVIEGASGEKFEDLMLRLFADLDMSHTHLEFNQPIIYGRARFYRLDPKKKDRLLNAPYVDNSYKWAGGGFLSTASDLCKFGNAMLYSYQQPSTAANANNATSGDICTPESNASINSINAVVPAIPTNSATNSAIPAYPVTNCTSTPINTAGYLTRETMHSIWQPVEKTRKKIGLVYSGTSDGTAFYAMGWGSIPSAPRPVHCRPQRMYVSHTGGAVGSSSVLLILPPEKMEGIEPPSNRAKGVVVAIIVNLQEVGMSALALEIARVFDRAR